MSDPMDPLQRWQRDVEMKLNAEAYYEDIFAFVTRPREKQTGAAIQTKIDQALSGMVKKNGKAGVAIQIMMPLCDIPLDEISGPDFAATMILRIQELPLVNEGSQGTGKPVEEVALITARLLHKWIPGNNLTQQGFARDAYTPSLEFDPKLTIDLKLNSRFRLAAAQKVQMPIISGNAGALSFACNTPGAAVYYTTDYSLPVPTSVNSAAVLWGYVIETESGLAIVTENGNPLAVANPITVAPGTAVRAAAYKPDTHLGSDVAIVTL